MTDAEMEAIEQENLENVRNALKTITSGNIYDRNGQLNAEGYAALRELDGLDLFWICDPCIKLVPDRRKVEEKKSFCEECKYLPNCDLAKHEEVDTCTKGESMDNNYDEENIQDVLEQIKEIREETTKDGKVFTVLPEYR